MTKKKSKGKAPLSMPKSRSIMPRKRERPLKRKRAKAAEVTDAGAEDMVVHGAKTKTIIIPSLEDPLHEVLQFRNEHGRIRKTLTVDKWIAHKEYKGKKHGLLQARSASGTQYKLRVHPKLAHTPADPFRTAGATAA
jgi:hypothetical protein